MSDISKDDALDAANVTHDVYKINHGTHPGADSGVNLALSDHTNWPVFSPTYIYPYIFYSFLFFLKVVVKMIPLYLLPLLKSQRSLLFFL